MDRLNFVLDRLPDFYNKEQQDSKIRNIIKAFTDEFKLLDDSIDYLDKSIGVDDTRGTDLDTQWGSLLNISRMPDEDDAIYRNRLKTSVTDLSGGTEYSIRYSIAVALGINNDETKMNQQIQVKDAWLYDGDEPNIDINYGNVVCKIDLDGALFSDYKADIDQVVRDAIKKSKASGINVQLIFTNYRIMTYRDLQSATYRELMGIRYNQLGDTI